MFQKSFTVGISLVIFLFPVLASAQSVQAYISTNTSLITLLTQLVQVLEVELQELVKANQGSVESNSPSSTTSYNSQITPLTATLTVNGVAVTAQAGQTANGASTYLWSTNPNGAHALYTYSESGTGQNVSCTEMVNGTGAGTVPSTLFGSQLSVMSQATAYPSSAMTRTLTCTDNTREQATVTFTINPTSGITTTVTPLTATLTVNAVPVTAQAGETDSGVAMYGWHANSDGSHLLYTFSNSGTGQNVLCTQTVNGTGAGTVASTLFGRILNMESTAASAPSSLMTRTLTCTDSTGEQATVNYTVQSTPPSGSIKE